jgi:hypothetical protein
MDRTGDAGGQGMQGAPDASLRKFGFRLVRAIHLPSRTDGTIGMNFDRIVFCYLYKIMFKQHSCHEKNGSAGGAIDRM